MNKDIGSESAMRIIWESMGLEWPGKDSQEISQKPEKLVEGRSEFFQARRSPSEKFSSTSGELKA